MLLMMLVQGPLWDALIHIMKYLNESSCFFSFRVYITVFHEIPFVLILNTNHHKASRKVPLISYVLDFNNQFHMCPLWFVFSSFSPSAFFSSIRNCSGYGNTVSFFLSLLLQKPCMSICLDKNIFLELRRRVLII